MNNLCIFDTHAHYNDEAFNSDRSELLNSLPNKGVCGIIECATTLEDSKKCIELSKEYPYIYCAVGVHPEDITDMNFYWTKKLKELSSYEKVVAIGEIGLDYYWDENPPRNIQLDIFEKQLILSNELNLPVIIHDRAAHQDTLQLLKKHKPRGVVHCFSGSVEMAKQIIDLGMYIGLGGVVTFKNARHSIDVAKSIPITRLLLETDAPYMTPVPFRGKRNDSSLIIYSATVIAKLRNMSIHELLAQTYNNALTLFNI